MRPYGASDRYDGYETEPYIKISRTRENVLAEDLVEEQLEAAEVLAAEGDADPHAIVELTPGRLDELQNGCGIMGCQCLYYDPLGDAAGRIVGSED